MVDDASSKATESAGFGFDDPGSKDRGGGGIEGVAPVSKDFGPRLSGELVPRGH